MVNTQQLRKEIFRLEFYINQLQERGEDTDFLERDLENARRRLPENMKMKGIFADN